MLAPVFRVSEPHLSARFADIRENSCRVLDQLLLI